MTTIMEERILLRNWTELLPLFVIRHLAEEKCEVLRQNGMSVYVPRPGVMIQAKATAYLNKERECVNSRQFNVC